MAISLVANTAASSTNTTTVTTAGINTTGVSLLAVCVSWLSAAGTVTFTLTDSYGNTWTHFSQRNSTTISTRISYVNSATPIVGASHTFTATSDSTATLPSIFVIAFRGSSSVFDGTDNSGNAASATTSAAGNTTPSQNNCVALSALSYADTTTLSIDGGFFISNQQPNNANATGGGFAYLIQTTATIYNPQWLWTNAVQVAQWNTTFRAQPPSGVVYNPRRAMAPLLAM